MPNQVCTFDDADTGMLAGNHVTINVSCAINQYLVGGTVSGLASGNYVTLSLNSGEQYHAVNSNNSFTFNHAMDDSSSYVVTVLNQPKTPRQNCVINNGTGTLTGENVTNIEVNCTINQYFIGGYLNDLIPENYLVIQNNGGDDLSLMNDGAFVFVTPLDDESSFEATILSQPFNPIQTCELFNGSGDIDGEDVDSIFIDCEFGDDLIYRHGFETPDAISRDLWDLDD